MQKEPAATYCPTSQKDWRRWLKKNHKSAESVWLVLYKKHALMPTVTWSELVDEALCFGWIDGKRISVSEDQYKQLFTKRKPKSTWSKINKDKVAQLIQKRLMTKAGLAAIDIAKKNGSWEILDEVEKLTIPPDLEEVFKRKPATKKNFLLLAKSVQKLLLTKLVFAKRPETRKARIAEIITACKPK